MRTHTHANTESHTHASTRAHAHTHTHSHTHTHTRTHTHTHTPVAYQGNGTEEKVFKKRKVFKEDLKELTRGRMADRNRELVPDNWSLVRERALITRKPLLCLTVQ